MTKKYNVENYPEELKYECWPKDHLKPLIYNFFRLDSQAEREKLVNCTDITRDRESQELAQQYLPEVQLVGQILRDERKSQNWSGVLFRVLADGSEYNKSKHLTVQYLYVWTRQSLPIIWSFVIPLLILVGLSLYINTPFSYFAIEETTAEGYIDLLLNFNAIFINIQSRAFLIMLLCSFYIFVGAYYIYDMRKRKIIQLRGLFVLYGLIFGLLHIPEMLIYDPLTTLEFGFSVWYDIPILQPFSMDLYLIPLLFLAAALLGLVIKLIESRLLNNTYLQRYFPFLNKIAHSMDYAPVFLYFSREDPESSWKLDEILYDSLHYCIGSKKMEVEPKNVKLGNYGGIRFFITGEWHSFEVKSEKNFIRHKQKTFLFGGTFAFLGIITCIGVVFALPYAVILDRFLGTFWAIIIYRLVFPVVLIYSGYYYFTHRLTPLTELEELYNPMYYLSETKLFALWSLEKEAQLKIREKVNDPFTKEDWDSFYDESLEEEKGVQNLCPKYAKNE